MPDKSCRRLKLLVFVIAIFTLGGIVYPVRGQEPLPELIITGQDISSIPSIVLHVFARDSQGNPLDLSSEPLSLTHDGAAVTATVDPRPYQAGTLTVFLVDVNEGVASEIPAIQEAIKQFASPGGGMMEQVDAIAIYQVGETEARELLAPTMFYNSVQNFFVDDLVPEAGHTALIDSLVSLLGQIEELKPNPDMVASIVVISDGTDAVSVNDPGVVIDQSIALSTAIHTINIHNVNLLPAGQEQGRAYLQGVASGSRGLYATLDNAEGLSNIWNRIAGFRNQPRVRYFVPGLTAGNYTVELGLANDPFVKTTTSVPIPENYPRVVINLSPESSKMSLPDLEEPVGLRLGATVSWLDGVERQISRASLLVNGQIVMDIPVEEIGEFTAEIDNLVYGPNTIEIAIVDEQSLPASNPPYQLTVSEGGREIPSELRAGGVGSSILRILLILLFLFLVAGVIFWAWRNKGLLPRGRRRRPISPAVETTAGLGDEELEPDVPFILAHLEVLEATTNMPERINLEGSVVRIGRSPSQADIAFREDITVSRFHASLMLEGSHYRIFDEQSTSGTWVNERQVPEYGIQLVDGDEIFLGSVHLRYRQL